MFQLNGTLTHEKKYINMIKHSLCHHRYDICLYLHYIQIRKSKNMVLLFTFSVRRSDEIGDIYNIKEGSKIPSNNMGYGIRFPEHKQSTTANHHLNISFYIRYTIPVTFHSNLIHKMLVYVLCNTYTPSQRLFDYCGLALYVCKVR